MTIRESLEELRLGERYQFRVTVGHDGQRFAGDLTLSPQGCFLDVRGELSEDRRIDTDWVGVKEMCCDAHTGTFLLDGLTVEQTLVSHLQRHPRPISYFEVRYRVAYAIFGRSLDAIPPTFSSLQIHSASIAQWVGYTYVQDSVVEQYHNGNLFPYQDHSHVEFAEDIAALGRLAVGYRPSTRYAVDEFAMSLQFPPTLHLSFEAPRPAAAVIHATRELETLVAFLLGHSIDIDRIQLDPTYRYGARLSLYFARAQTGERDGTYPFFPLGLNLRHDTLGLPPLPTTLFSHYFALSPGAKAHFQRYLKYRTLENPEERFLGFFRLLEKLCHEQEAFLPEATLAELIERAQPFLTRHFDDKKSVQRFLRQIPRWNLAKLNAASFIGRFLMTIPYGLRRRWIYDASHLEAICKLRNDLTHANETQPTSDDVEQQAKFIEVLLVLRLLMEIGVPLETAALVIPRLTGHGLIEPPPQFHGIPAEHGNGPTHTV